MRIAALALLGSLGLAVSAVSASAAPAVPSLDTQQASNIVEVAGGCGRWAHPNRWGRCVPNGYGRWSQSRDYYYGGGSSGLRRKTSACGGLFSTELLRYVQRLEQRCARLPSVT